MRRSAFITLLFVVTLLPYEGTSANAFQDSVSRGNSYPSCNRNQPWICRTPITTCVFINGQPLKTAELDGQGCWTETKPSADIGYELGACLDGVRDNEVVVETRRLEVGYIQFKSGSWSSGNCRTLNLQTAELNDGNYLLQVRVSDTVLEDIKTVNFQILNGRPIVEVGGVSSVAAKESSRKAEATVQFLAKHAVSAAVELTGKRQKVIRVEFDSKMLANSEYAIFWGLEFSTKYSFTITSRNANGESDPVSGTFKTATAPKAKPTSKSQDSSSKSSASRTPSAGVSCPVVLYWRLDRAESALRNAGCTPSSIEAPGCEAFLGIVRKSNWTVVGQRGGSLYACQR
jgi:hypothetical protein